MSNNGISDSAASSENDDPVDVDFSEFRKAASATYVSTPIKATRRILFNHLNKSIAERGHFHVDQMYGSGSGILIKHDDIFYILTADHVIANATGYAFTNESPFWVTSQSDSFPQELLAFLMAAQIVHIGETVPDRGRNFKSEDMILIELFSPNTKSMPNRFIDLDANPDILASKESFFEGQFLIAAGYPFETNSFEFFDETPHGKTHSTLLHRLIVDGVCEFDAGEPIMTKGLASGTFPDLSGASGGIVTNVPAPGDSVKMLGMLLSAGSTIVRFIPSYVIAEGLANKDRARITAVDPAFKGQPPREIRKMFLDMFGMGRANNTDKPA
jgi:hypothetical protein